MPDLSITPLDDLSTLRARGADAISFLQGQLSQDLGQLRNRGALLAGLHNPQGRCLALLRVLRLADDDLLLVLPAERAGAVRSHLARYVLRSKVTLEDASTAWRAYGVSGPDAEAAASTRNHLALNASGLRQLVVAPRGETLPDGDVASREAWRLEDIEAGIPEVLDATAGLFVAQMLNLDLIGAISFDKGCYTGQEVIARAHYRGQVKRRMQRFFTGSVTELVPGQKIGLPDGRRALLISSAPAEGGGQQFLAVTTLPASAPASDDGAEQGEGAPAERLACEQLPLPYSLPG